MNILLDLDGTLTDPRIGIVGSIRHALAKLNRESPPEDDLVRFIGPTLRDAFAELLSTDDPALIEQAMISYRERYSTAGLFENQVYDGIPAALEALNHKGAALFLATAKPYPFAQRILDHFRLTQFFRGVFGSELGGALSDKSSLIAHVLRHEHLDPADTVMVGDRSHDAIGAHANKITSIGVLWGYGTEEELLAAGCKFLLRAPSELASLVI